MSENKQDYDKKKALYNRKYKTTLSKKRDSIQRRRQVLITQRAIALGAVLVLLIGIVSLSTKKSSTDNASGSGPLSTIGRRANTKVKKIVEIRPELDVQLLTVNPYSRPQVATDPITAVVVHYTGNPGTTAQNNRDYFESLKDKMEEKISSHFVIGLEGEIVQCVPTAEIAYASNDRNGDTVSIECCHPDETGEFNQATYDSLVYLVAWLCGAFDLDTEDGIIRHYDVTGKECPRYFVENEYAWLKFKEDVETYIQENGTPVIDAQDE